MNNNIPPVVMFVFYNNTMLYFPYTKNNDGFMHNSKISIMILHLWKAKDYGLPSTDHLFSNK